MMTYEQLAQAYAQACRVRDMALAQLEDIGAGYAEKMDDFVRVVRCKDCVAAVTDGNGMLRCDCDWQHVDADFYCGSGERRADNAAD